MATKQSGRSLLAEYQQKERLLQQLSDELKALESNKALTEELEFKHALQDLLTAHGKTEQDVLELLSPDSTESQPANDGRRAKRKLKVYVNPHTGEKVETRGGNHKKLKEWQAEHGKPEVESWLQS